VAKPGGDHGNQYTGAKARTSGFGKPGLEDLGIPSQRAAEMKQLEAIGEVARPDGSTHHRPKVSALRTPSAATLPELGIPRQRAVALDMHICGCNFGL